MPFKIAKRSLYLYQDHYGSTVKIFGGEPLMEKKRLFEILEYGKGYRFEVTTNGTLIDKDIIVRFLEKGVDLRVSIDGDHKTQIESKGSCSTRAIDNIPKRYRDMLSVNMVVTSKSVKMFSKNFNYLIDEGFTSFNLLPAYFTRWTKESLIDLIDELKNIMRIIKEREVILINKRSFQHNILYNTGLIIDCNGDIYNDNTMMNIDSVGKKENLKLANISDIQSFTELKTVQPDIVYSETDLFLNRIFNCFVRSI